MFKVIEVSHIRSSLSPFKVAQGYVVEYPEKVKIALGKIFEDYNNTFNQIVPLNQEWSEDYQFARLSNGDYFNFAVQIDMKGLEDEFLEWSKNASIDEVKESLRRRICEIENSIAMYQMLSAIFDSGEDHFANGWRKALNEFREKTGKSVVLLAVTKEKYEGMLASEFGGYVDKKEVYELSGFDDFWGPEEFLKNKEREDVIYFVRSSQPVSWQRNPRTKVNHPILMYSQLRKIIKAKSITFNVDDAAWYENLNGVNYVKIINDTKEYMIRMGLGFPLNSYGDLVDKENLKLTKNFERFLLKNEVDPEEVIKGEKLIRVKPLKLFYGGYGHLRGRILDKEFRQKLKRELSLRGPYICQIEMEMPKVKDEEGREYAYIDRVFYAYLNENPVFIGGFRNLMPINSFEFKRGRIHGNSEAVWAKIV
jgi:hypothetical protein